MYRSVGAVQLPASSVVRYDSRKACQDGTTGVGIYVNQGLDKCSPTCMHLY